MSAKAECVRLVPRLRVVDGGKQIAENGGMTAKKGAKASGGRNGEESKDRVASARSTAPTSREEAERYTREYFAKVEEKFARMQSASLLNLVDDLIDLRMELDRRGFTEAADLLLTIEDHISAYVTSEIAGKLVSETTTRKDLEKGNAAATARQRKSNLAALNEYLVGQGKAPVVKRRPTSARNALFVRLVNTVVDCRERGVSDLEIAENTLQSIRNILQIDTSSIDRSSVVRKDAEAFVRAAYRAAGIERADNATNAKSKQRSRAHRARRTDN